MVRVRVRVSSRVRVSVSFIFYCISALRCMLKDRKLTHGPAALVVRWLTFWHLTTPIRVRLPPAPGVHKYFCTFFQVFFQVFCKLRLWLVLALMLVLGLP